MLEVRPGPCWATDLEEGVALEWTEAGLGGGDRWSKRETPGNLAAGG